MLPGVPVVLQTICRPLNISEMMGGRREEHGREERLGALRRYNRRTREGFRHRLCAHGYFPNLQNLRQLRLEYFNIAISQQVEGV